jgi:long-chain fatty acid transport protein
MRRLCVVLLSLAPSAAFAGGYELLGNGTAALGRGTAFTARADDATAVEYNVAGLARQRGTRLLIDGKLNLNTYEFTRAGAYPDDPNLSYAGMPYAKVGNTNGIFFAPFIGLSTDFGRLDRWTFGLSLYGPSAADGNRTYPDSVAGAPAPQRYDLTQAHLLVVYPTLSAAVRVTKWLDLGLSLHLAWGSLDFKATAFTDIGRANCPYPEAPQCDAALHIQTSGFTATASLGAMFRPKPFLALGLHLRGPVVLNTSGKVGVAAAMNAPPAIQKGLPADAVDASFHTKLPWVLRAGLRYIFLGKGAREDGDLELDGTYEAWGDAQGVGDRLEIPQLGAFSDIKALVVHHFRDTFSARLGGQYNLYVRQAMLMFRLGAYVDSAATHLEDTRLDFDAGAKYGATVGFGFQIRGISVNLAYAYVFSPDRDVTNGNVRVINGTTGDTTGAGGADLPVFNNGHYHAQNLVVALGIGIVWDELLKRERVITYE